MCYGRGLRSESRCVELGVSMLEQDTKITGSSSVLEQWKGSQMTIGVFLLSGLLSSQWRPDRRCRRYRWWRRCGRQSRARLDTQKPAPAKLPMAYRPEAVSVIVTMPSIGTFSTTFVPPPIQRTSMRSTLVRCPSPKCGYMPKLL